MTKWSLMSGWWWLGVTLLAPFVVGAASPVGPAVGWGNPAYGKINVPPDLSEVIAVSARGGDNYVGYSLVLSRRGTVSAWGYSDRGCTNVPAGLSNVVAISAGLNNAFALKQDGTVAAWGREAATNVPAGLSNVTQLAGGRAPIALLQNGSVVAWGDGQHANLPVGLNDVKQVAVGWDHGLALRSNGTVVAWGVGPGTNVPVNLSNVMAIASGDFGSMALLTNRTVVAWGSSMVTNVPPSLTNVVKIAAGTIAGGAVKADGRVVVWSYPSYTELDAPPGVSNVAYLAIGYDHALAVTIEPQFTSIDLNPQGVEIRFPTFSDQNYAVEYTPAMGAGWTNLGSTLGGSGFPMTVLDTNTTEGARFYRLRQ